MFVCALLFILLASLQEVTVRCQASDIPCNDQQEACTCDEMEEVCRFNLIVEELQTSTSYKLSGAGELITRGTPGDTYFVNGSGYIPSLDSSVCPEGNSNSSPPECGVCRPMGEMQIINSEEEFRELLDCSIPMTVDGISYRLFIAVNGRIPGPTLIVTEGQEVVVNVHNKLTSEGIAIHWHGIHQRGTPWMDGVPSLSHIPIVPGGRFQYRFNATPAGTHWYHSHLGAQRTDGLFGALIVRESSSRRAEIDSALNATMLSELSFDQIIDIPAEHTLTLLDWQRESSIDLFVQIHSTLGFYPNKPLGDIPRQRSITDNLYARTQSIDGVEVGPVPFFSGLINGRGRYNSTTHSILSVFNVSTSQAYRFRLIGAQSLYAFRFEIEGHKLHVIATDGQFIRPIKVDYIIIHSGERYDFIPEIIDPSVQPKNFLIRAQTLEKELDNSAEAIFHYNGEEAPDMLMMYNNIFKSTRRCNSSSPCTVLNCPFESYPQSAHLKCISVNKLQALFSTDTSEIPTLDVEAIFFNFGFEGQSSTSAINGKNFLSPTTPYQTTPGEYSRDQMDPSKTCDRCNSNSQNKIEDCTCIHLVKIMEAEAIPPDNRDKSIVMVFSAVGERDARLHGFSHPIHLHGHSFYVVHTGYGEYHNGTLEYNSEDVSCGGDQNCLEPSWKDNVPPDNLTINAATIQKDTVIVPAGGYVVIAFLANNPGYWFLHCHIEVHQLEGMAVVIQEYPEDIHPSPPEFINRIGDFPPFSAPGFSPYPTCTNPPTPNTPANGVPSYWRIIAAIFISFTIVLVLVLVVICIFCLCLAINA